MSETQPHVPRRRALDETGAPPWVVALIRLLTVRLLILFVAVPIITLFLLAVFSKMHNILGIILMAFFLSFALEPGVNWFAKRGWRRGSATGLIFLIAFLSGLLLLALVIPAIVTGAKQLVSAAPQLVDKFVSLAGRLGWHVSAEKVTAQIQAHAKDIAASAAGVAGNLFGIASSIIGGLFRWTTIALFTFYIVAEGPKLRRTLLGALPPEPQQRVLFIWDQAIEKTGGYFYSRLLLAVINGTGMYLVLRIFNVPFAAPLAIFEGVVAEFIPIVGTYIAGAAPVMVAFLYDPTSGIAALAYILIYQQIENYVLSPRLTAKTMNLHPAVAFGAALTGGALGGILMAFLALPVAGVVQAAVHEYGQRYDVVVGELTSDTATPKKEPRSGEWRSLFNRRKDGPNGGDSGDAT